ncbi:MAG: hypothetical protein R6X31_04010 [Anaerolineae bacterium]
MNVERTSGNGESGDHMPVRRVVSTWWPLALSWLLMAAEGPALSAIVARLANPEINLAAFGGIVYPLALIIEAPIIMLLSASTALSRDWDSYRKLRRFMMWMGAALTAVHVLVAFTPLYDVVVVQLIRPPEEIVELARVGLMITVPWTWAIAYRRLKQGVLIRFGHSRTVGLGTFVRLSADGIVLGVGYLVGTIPGVVVAASALIAGVVSEAVYAGLRARPVVEHQLKKAPPVEQPLTPRAFVDFYTPLALTSLFRLVAEPLSSAALSRMPRALDSLAVWSVVTGFVFLPRSLGVAYNEVVIALLDEPRSSRALRRFMAVLTLVVTVLLLVVAATPLGMVWFERVSGLRPDLAELSRSGLWVALLMPALAVLQSWYQGLIVHSRRTRGITEAVVVYLLTSGGVLWGGVVWGRTAGLYVGLAAVTLGRLTQTIWLWYRSRPAVTRVNERDEGLSPFQGADITVR